MRQWNPACVTRADIPTPPLGPRAPEHSAPFCLVWWRLQPGACVRGSPLLPCPPLRLCVTESLRESPCHGLVSPSGWFCVCDVRSSLAASLDWINETDGGEDGNRQLSMHFGKVVCFLFLNSPVPQKSGRSRSRTPWELTWVRGLLQTKLCKVQTWGMTWHAEVLEGRKLPFGWGRAHLHAARVLCKRSSEGVCWLFPFCYALAVWE